MGSFDPKPDAGRSTGYMVRRRHVRDEGLIVLPASTRTMVCNLHSPVEFLFVDFACLKTEKWPTSPSYRMADANLVFLGGERIADVPPFNDERMERDFQIVGSYKYLIKEPIGLDSALATGRTSWETLDGDEFTVPSSAFSRDIIDFPLTTAAATGWVVDFTGVPSGGTFRLRVDGVDTVDLAWDAEYDAIDTALQTVVGPGVIVVGPAPFTITLPGDGGVLAVGDNSLTGTSPNVTVEAI